MKRRLFNVLAGLSLVLCAITAGMWLFMPSSSSVLTVAFAGRYWEFCIRDEKYFIVTIGDYTRSESAHWRANSVADYNNQVVGRSIYIQGGDAEFGIPWIEAPFCVLGPDHQSLTRSWPQGWPPEMCNGRYTRISLTRLPPVAPVILTAVLPLFWGMHFLTRALSARKSAIHGRCLSCGYDLRATPDRCPECGTIPSAIAETKA